MTLVGDTPFSSTSHRPPSCAWTTSTGSPHCHQVPPARAVGAVSPGGCLPGALPPPPPRLFPRRAARCPVISPSAVRGCDYRLALPVHSDCSRAGACSGVRRRRRVRRMKEHHGDPAYLLPRVLHLPAVWRHFSGLNSEGGQGSGAGKGHPMEHGFAPTSRSPAHVRL